jgi:imidazolonepropionase-like amidohydrolase
MCPGSHLHASYEDDGVTCPLCAYPKHAPLELLDQASGLVGSGMITELSNEVAAHTSVLDSMNLRSPDLRRLAEGGVTTVFASPDSSAVIGPRGAILRTAGPVQDRVIEPAGAVHAAISSDPYRGSMSNAPPFRGFVTARTRRPNTRMGVTWVFRKAFVDAERHANGLPVGGAETAPYEALDVLWGVRSGEIPLRVHARQKNDIESAIRLTGEFGFGFTLLEATEAFELIDEIRAAGVPVILGPIETDPTGPRRFSPETRRASLATFGALLDAGITTALTAQDLRDENGLARQAMYAVRNGVDPQAALRAVTLTPAEILGVSDRLGSVEVGKQADLVVWSGDPLSPTSRPVVVIVNGRVEVDRR